MKAPSVLGEELLEDELLLVGATGRIVRDDKRGPIISVLLLVATQITALHMAVQFKFVISFLYDLGFLGLMVV